MRKGIRAVAVGDYSIEGLVVGDDVRHGDVWLARYDPDANDGSGDIGWTLDPAEALAFSDGAEALALWRRVSVVRPVRRDGKLNRPLSDYSIVISPLPE